MKTYGENFWEISPVVNWASIILIMVFSILNQMQTRSIYFTLAFSQADTDVEIFMELPLGVDGPKGGICKYYVLFT